MININWSVSVSELRRKYPALTVMLDGFIGGAVLSPFEIPCSGKELEIIQRLSVLLTDETARVNNACNFLNWEWAKVVGSEQVKEGIEALVLSAANLLGDDGGCAPPSGPN